MLDNKKEQERAELHRTIWGIANPYAAVWTSGILSNMCSAHEQDYPGYFKDFFLCGNCLAVFSARQLPLIFVWLICFPFLKSTDIFLFREILSNAWQKGSGDSVTAIV